MEFDVFQHRETGNMFVVKSGQLHSVNAWTWGRRSFVPDGRVCRGVVTDWLWSCGDGGWPPDGVGELQAARHFGQPKVKSWDGWDWVDNAATHSHP